MKNTIIIVAVILAAGIGIYYLASNSGYGGTYTAPNAVSPVASSPAPAAPAPAAPAPSAPAATPPAKVAAINISNFSFRPSTITVKTGTKVTWTNSDSVPHTVTSDSGNLLNSGALSTGQSFSFTFTNPGSFSYHCAIHTMMKGTVIVQN